MQNQFPPDIQALIAQQMASGNYDSQDQLFRVALKQLVERDEEVRAIQRSIDLLDAGELGVPLDDAFAQIRAKNGISTDA